MPHEAPRAITTTKGVWDQLSPSYFYLPESKASLTFSFPSFKKTEPSVLRNVYKCWEEDVYGSSHRNFNFTSLTHIENNLNVYQQENGGINTVVFRLIHLSNYYIAVIKKKALVETQYE